MNKIGFKAGKDESKPVEREIRHQEYYKTKSGLECIDVAQDFDFNLGNAIKYIWRAGKKFENGLSTKEKAVEDFARDFEQKVRGGAAMDGAALTAAHPPLLHDLKGGLYPLAARRHGLRPDAVERSLRLAVESTWMRGSLPGIARKRAVSAGSALISHLR